MIDHRFGGSWTQEKLDRVRKYLPAYTKIFDVNEKAQYLRTVYVDAFAGTGYSAPPVQAYDSIDLTLFPELLDIEVQGFLKGSAQIALEVEPHFDHYLFIEKEPQYAEELERLRLTYINSGLSIEVVQADATSFLPTWVEKQNWVKTRAVIFLDPYSMEVDWKTLEVISKGKVDLWLLWPIGQAINRLITRDKLPPGSWGDALTRAFGTDEWKTRFYAKKSQTSFNFEDSEEEQFEKIADYPGIERFFIERLQLLFPHVAQNPLYLYNSLNCPLYLLCFAAHSPTAVKIAQDILKA